MSTDNVKKKKPADKEKRKTVTPPREDDLFQETINEIRELETEAASVAPLDLAAFKKFQSEEMIRQFFNHRMTTSTLKEAIKEKALLQLYTRINQLPTEKLMDIIERLNRMSNQDARRLFGEDEKGAGGGQGSSASGGIGALQIIFKQGLEGKPAGDIGIGVQGFSKETFPRLDQILVAAEAIISEAKDVTPEADADEEEDDS